MSFRVLFCSCVFSVLLVLRLPRFGKRELILVLFVRLFGLCMFRFVGFLFLLGSGKGCGLWLWHSLDFSLTFFLHCSKCVCSNTQGKYRGFHLLPMGLRDIIDPLLVTLCPHDIIDLWYYRGWILESAEMFFFSFKSICNPAWTNEHNYFPIKVSLYPVGFQDRI